MVHMMMSNNRIGTPAAGLEVILGTMPIDIYLKGEALKCGYRIKAHFPREEAKNGHIQRYSKEARDAGIDKLKSDEMPNTRLWHQAYNVSKPESGLDCREGLHIYMDGSKTKVGTGTGVCVMDEDRIIKTRRAYNLPNYCTVFQAELAAIREGCKLIPGHTKHKRATIITDSPRFLQ